MEIHNHGKNLKLNFQVKSDKANTSSDVKSGNAVDQTEQVKPQRLIERLQGDADVRNRLLVEIQAKIHAGEYSTRVAAEQAAQQIVG